MYRHRFTSFPCLKAVPVAGSRHNDPDAEGSGGEYNLKLLQHMHKGEVCYTTCQDMKHEQTPEHLVQFRSWFKEESPKDVDVHVAA